MKKIFSILTPSEIRKSFALTVVLVINAAVEMTGIASIAPFLSVIGSQDAIRSNPKIAFLYNYFGFEDTHVFVLFLGITAFAVLILTSVFRAVTIYLKSNYIQMRRHTLSVRLLHRYLRQPYEYFMNRNSSDMSKAILVEVDTAIANVLAPLLDIISYGFITLAILALLFYLEPMVAVSLAAGFGVLYLLFYLTIRNKNADLGHKRKESRTAQFQTISEILGGVKELKILGREKAYLDLYEPASLLFSKTQVKAQAYSDVPRYVVEALGFTIIFGILFFMLSAGKDLGQILPVIGVYVFAGYRLLPALQNIYSAFTKLRFGKPALDALHEDLMQLAALPHYQSTEVIRLEQSLELKDVSYTYPGLQTPALQNISLTVPKGSSLGIIGKTGAGKSTLVDVILGLIDASDGEILINGQKLSDSDKRKWQNNIGYVPQYIFLSDDTVASNIAFGVPKSEINMEAVKRAAAMAQINGFIENDLKDGYDTVVGERGIRLSGGQRQRIGIARALYHDPDIIILDEATSALDMETEADVIRSIEGLSATKTIISITHRLQAVERYDQILTLSRGKMESIAANTGR